MDAVALRAGTQAGGTGATTSAAPTNGPSSSAPIAGGGPVAAPSQPALLGERLLPAPIGEPQTIHLPDGSMLVPIARVDASGNRIPLTGGAGSAPLMGGGGNAAVETPAQQAARTSGITGGGVLRAAPGTAVSAAGAAVPAAGDVFEPLGFLYNDKYFKKFHDAGGINVDDRAKVEERAIRSTFAYLLEEEPDVDDFGVTGVTIRAADPATDSDLLNVNPRSHLLVDVHGVQGNGVRRTIPSVMNRDGAVFVDPRIGRG
jgi:hypothetical protein